MSFFFIFIDFQALSPTFCCPALTPEYKIQQFFFEEAGADAGAIRGLDGDALPEALADPSLVEEAGVSVGSGHD